MSPRDHDVPQDDLPAQNLEAERAVLAAMMLGPEGIAEARGMVQAKHFYRRAHQLVYTALTELYANGSPTDLISLAEELRRRGALADAGGQAGIAQLMESATSTANVRHHARLVRERAVRRAVRDAGYSLLQQIVDPAADVDAVVEQHRRRVREIADDKRSIDRRAWMADILTLREVVEREWPPIESIVGNGLLTRGSYGLFAGHSGLGKTYMTIQLVSDILLERPFLGQRTRPCRVGMLEFEMPWQSMKARAHRLGGLDAVSTGCDLLCMPRGRWYFTERDTIERIVDWCQEKQLGLLIPDPLNRIRLGDSNDEEVAAALLDAIHEIVERTGTTLLCVAHVRKTPSMGNGAASRTSTASLDSIKGPSRYVDDADSVFMLDEVLDGNERLLRFEWAKSRFGEKPSYVYMKRNSTGFFDVVDSPTARRDAKDDRVANLLRNAWTTGVRVEDVEAEMGCSRTAARNLLKRLGAIPRGSTNKLRWYDRESIGVLDARQGELDPSAECTPSDEVQNRAPVPSGDAEVAPW